jgi:hypothetical protein
MNEPDPTPKPRRRCPRRKPAARAAGAARAEPGLQDEIDMLRESIRLLGELAAEEPIPAKKAYIYDVQGKQATRLNTLENTRRKQQEGQDTSGTLDQAIAIVVKNLRENGCHE